MQTFERLRLWHKKKQSWNQITGKLNQKQEEILDNSYSQERGEESEVRATNNLTIWKAKPQYEKQSPSPVSVHITHLELKGSEYLGKTSCKHSRSKAKV